MCGGRMEIIPCSHVGHLFRRVMPYSWEGDGYRTMIRNSLRVAEVWMDQYKKIYYDRIYYSQNDVKNILLVYIIPKIRLFYESAYGNTSNKTCYM